MTVDLLRSTLAWSALLNMGILLWWFLFITLAHDWVYRVHSRFLKIPVEQFDTIHYAGMLIYKVVIFTFFIVPYLALRIVI
ncbi:MAG: DUF6868 family protein [Desulfuromonadales bacterium]